jgi:hypothetical protein
MGYFEAVSPGLLGNLPAVLAWGAGAAVAAVLLRRGGGRAEKLFLAGVCLMLFTSLAGPIGFSIIRNSMAGSLDLHRLAILNTWISLPLFALELAGLVCLAWGFWLRFRPRETEAA